MLGSLGLPGARRGEGAPAGCAEIPPRAQPQPNDPPPPISLLRRTVILCRMG